MAPITEARPAQSSRRRDGPRPSATKRAAPPDGPNGSEVSLKRRKLEEPYVRDNDYILRKFKGRRISFTIHLYPTYFKFNGQDGSWGYDSIMKCVLQHVQRGTVPHEMMEALLSGGAPFYDGCLIVEIHNHRDRDSKKNGAGRKEEDKDKFSMHRYTEQLTPSPYAPYPVGAKAASTPDLRKDDDKTASDRAKTKEGDGPHIVTTVLHPTEQSKHEEMMILLKTPASAMPNRKKGSDAANQSQAPSLSVPPTPIGGPVGAANTQGEKMALSQNDIYSFQADMLVATEPPLLLDVPSTAEDSHAIIDRLAHPLHSAKAPSAKERKRTTAEIEAGEAKVAELERRLLTFDDRIKPSAGIAGAAAGDNSASSSTLGFNRFKTIENIKQQHEEADRQKKEEEARLAVEKRALDEQAQQQQRVQAAQKQRELQLQQAQQQQQQQQAAKKQHMLAQHQAEQLRQQQMQHQAQLSAQQANLMQAHAHPGNQHGAQGSPVMRQQTQTPMMNSSPMVAQSGFPMARSASQQGLNTGSPARPPSAALQQRQPHPGVAMAKNASQQANGSQNNTPHMQSTPSMAQAMPGNRQISATPRLQPGSPAVNMQQGTPGVPSQLTPNAMMMQAGNHNVQGLTAEQLVMLNAQRTANQGGIANAQNPEAFQLMHQVAKVQQELKRTMHLYHQAKNTGDMASQNAAQARIVALHNTRDKLNQAMMAQRQQQAVNQQQMGGNQGTPGMQQSTPQMNHGHPGHTPQMGQQPNMHNNSDMAQQQAQLMAHQQQQQQQRRQAAQIQQLINHHGGTIPQHVMANMQPHQQNLVRQHVQNNAKMLAMRRSQQQVQAMAGGNGDYMHNMQQAKLQLQMQMQQQQQGNNLGNNMGNMGNGMPQSSPMQGGNNFNQMGMQQAMNLQQQQQQFSNQQFAQNNPNNLDAQFAAMSAALQQGNQQQGQQGGRMQ